MAKGAKVFASGNSGAVAIAPCCESLLELPPVVVGSLQATTGTPGNGCGSLKACAACTLLSFCSWNSIDSVCASTSALTVMLPADQSKFSASCNGPDASYFQGAQILDTYPKQTPGPTPAFDKKLYSVKPHVDMDGAGWPTQYTGYLPPSGCNVPTVDFAAKYPTGLPGCDLHSHTADPAGIKTFDIVSDARLPVETHIPNYPLGANPKLPDHLVGGYTDPRDAILQPRALWVEPNFDHVGCLGGPCDQTHRAAASKLLGHDTVDGAQHVQATTMSKADNPLE